MDELSNVAIRTFLTGLIGPFFWILVTAIPLWLIRKYAPRAEWWLYTPLSQVIRRLVARVRAGRLTVLRRPSRGAGR